MTPVFAAAPPIAVNIDGRVSNPDPAPLLDGGAVFVPLRGVLENLGAKVEYSPAEKRIEITQNGKKYLLRAGVPGATIDAEVVPLAASKVVAGRAFVPLRSLAELFGYRVSWLDAQRTVAIYTNGSLKPANVNHRLELKNAGSFGVEIDFVDKTPAQIAALLDAAKSSGVGLIKTRFDWATLQPTRESPFLWTQYDTVVREARARDLRIVGILGDSTQWASTARSTDPDDWRHSPPKDAETPAWANYVRRVVGRYKVDVQAWQVWENPGAQNFRSVARFYRKLTRAAVDAARESDPNAVIHAAEPGGVELDFVSDLASNGLTPALDGVEVFPVSQWQPGVRNAPESFLLPYATLRDRLQLPDGKTRDYWVGGVSLPVVETGGVSVVPVSAGSAGAAPSGAYSPQAQADYLVQMFALGLAGGSEKVFWNQLQDEAGSGSKRGTGLLTADGTPRPAFAALQGTTKNLGGKPYAGNLALGPNGVALLFDDKKSGTLVVWAPGGSATLAMSSSVLPASAPGTISVATRPDSLVTDASGTVVSAPEGTLRLSNRPLFISNVARETLTAAAARLSPPGGTTGLRLEANGPSYAGRDEVSANFGPNGGENGISWRAFTNFGGMAQSYIKSGGQTGLTTEAQRDIMDLKSSRPFIYLDIADDFLYFAGGVPVTVTVTVKRPFKIASSIVNSASGFRIEYDSPTGYKTTVLQSVEEGEGWATYTFAIPDATFANAEGYDLLINSGGSKRDLSFGSISVKRGISAGVAPTVEAVAPVAAAAN